SIPFWSRAKKRLKTRRRGRNLTTARTDRETRPTPRWRSPRARRPASPSSSAYVTRRPPATRAVLPGDRRALSSRQCSERTARPCLLGPGPQLPADLGRDPVDGVEVLRDDLGILHADPDSLFQERHQLQDAGRIDDPAVMGRAVMAPC